MAPFLLVVGKMEKNYLYVDFEEHLLAIRSEPTMLAVELTRPANTTAYTPGDVISDNAAASTLLHFADFFRTSGGTGYLMRASLTTNKKSITSRVRVHLFGALDPTVAADNAPYREIYADAPKRLGYFDLPAMSTAVDTTNSDMSRAMNNELRHFVKASAGSRSLYVLLETLDAFTPDSGQRFLLVLAIENR